VNVRGVNYKSFYHGQVGVELELGAGDAPFSFSPAEIHKFLLHLRKIRPVHIFNLLHVDYLEPDRDEITELVRLVTEQKIPVWSEGDGNSFPPWMSNTSWRSVHISSEPWYQYAVNEIIFHMDEGMEPQIDQTHLQNGTGLYLLLHSKGDVERAILFMSKDRKPWRLRIARRFEVLSDLTSLNISKLSEDL